MTSQIPEVYDPQRALVENWKDFFFNRRDDLFVLKCIEGDVVLNGRWCLLNIMLTMPLISRHRPISRDKHLLLSGIYDKNSHARILNNISRSLEEVGYSREQLGHDIIMTANDALNMCYTHLGSFIAPMDIFTIAETVLQEEAVDLCTIDYGDVNDRNIGRMEKAFNDQKKRLDDLLCSDKLPINIFRAPLLCGALKKDQFYQFLLSAAPRTDIDEKMFLRPVVGSFLSGMKGIFDFAIESRAGAKAYHYSKREMPKVSYMSRKFHIQNSIMWHLYPGDCGATTYMEYEPTKKTVQFYLGKFYLNDAGQLVELVEDDFNKVIGRTLKFRDPITCLYTDGYCEICGGTATKSFPRHGNLGFLSNINTGSPLTQKVLSAKHLSMTSTAEYEIPADLHEIFMVDNSNIYLMPSQRRKIKGLALGFTPKDVAKLNDLKYIQNENIKPAYFSDIKYLSLGKVMSDGTIGFSPKRVSMKAQKTQEDSSKKSSDIKIESNNYPHLSPEVLEVIKNHRDDLIFQDGKIWLLLRNIDPDEPIMQCTVMHDSIRNFVDKFKNLVTKDVVRMYSANDLMQELCKMIWSQVPTHITHIACFARACMITSRKDFNIPIVTNPERVMFGALNRNIPMRSIGALFAFEGANVAANRPITYISPKRHLIYDELMGYGDIIERDMAYPVVTGSQVQYDL